MSDNLRWRYGDTNPVFAAVDSTTVIEIGDLLWQDVDDAKPASSLAGERFGNTFTGQGSVGEQLQHEFTNSFLGVAMQPSRNGDTAPVRVAATGVFEFDCDTGGDGDTFELGELIGVAGILYPGHPDADDGSETPGLMKQAVEKVTNSRYAIGRVAKREASPAGSVLIDIRNTVMTGGVEGSSPSGV